MADTHTIRMHITVNSGFKSQNKVHSHTHTMIQRLLSSSQFKWKTLKHCTGFLCPKGLYTVQRQSVCQSVFCFPVTHYPRAESYWMFLWQVHCNTVGKGRKETLPIRLAFHSSHLSHWLMIGCSQSPCPRQPPSVCPIHSTCTGLPPHWSAITSMLS